MTKTVVLSIQLPVELAAYQSNNKALAMCKSCGKLQAEKCKDFQPHNATTVTRASPSVYFKVTGMSGKDSSFRYYKLNQLQDLLEGFGE
jgi:hypothetical protein